MNRSMEQNLLSLMPTHGPELPGRLVDAARTLLVQSRTHASTLKADEEVARMYACAHIACERLKIPLDLPPIEPRPPIPPRVYKRLFNFLIKILPERQARVSTPSAKLRESKGFSSPAPLGSAIKRTPHTGLIRTPSNTAEISSPRKITLVDTPSKSTSRGVVKSIKQGAGMCPWVRGVLAYLVWDSKQDKWARYILAGVEYALMPGGKRTKDPWVVENMSAVVAAFWTISMIALEAAKHPPLTTLQSSSENILKRTILAMRQARRKIDVRGLSEDEYWDGWCDIARPSVEEAMRRAERDWIQADWYQALESAIADDTTGTQEAESGKVRKRKRNGKSPQRTPQEEAPMQIYKPDTMHQERYDFWSDKRRARQAAWKDSTLARLRDAEASADAMAVNV